jgi:deoxyribonuclease V
MRIDALHRWPHDVPAAIRLQRRLAARVRLEPIRRKVRLVAGADATFTADDGWVIAAAVVLDLGTGALISSARAVRRCVFPYIPGLLSFRELPCIIAAFRKLRVAPEAVLYDGHGLAHPRRLGISAHLGLWLNIPTVGCAKSRLLGEFEEVPAEHGACRPLWHCGEHIGTVLRTRSGVKPVFVSPGHLCDHASAVQLTLATATRFRLPEPTRMAHQIVTAIRRAGSERVNQCPRCLTTESREVN